jgi:carboxyl-terminal processing protease
VAAPNAQNDGGWRHDSLAAFDEAWQTISDTFYDPTFGGVDWTAVRAELRPRAEAARSADDVRRVIVDMLARLKRSHFVLLSASAIGENGPLGPATVPIDVRVTSAGLAVTRVAPAADANPVRAGDVVLAIDSLDTDGWQVSGDEPAARQRRLDLWRRAYRALHGDPGSRAVLRLRSPAGDAREVTVLRAAEPGATVNVGNLPPLTVRSETRALETPARRAVGYFGFNVWMTAIDAPLGEAIARFREADGLIIDLRGNPGGLAPMISGVSGYLLSDPAQLLGRMHTRDAQLEFHPNPRHAMADGRPLVPYGGPVAILVDELTGSASECFAGGLQSLGRARVFGRPSMGEALPALTKRLSNGDVLMYAIGDFVTSSGRTLEGNGVQPDEPVPLTTAALGAGEDADVVAALRWVDSLKSKL